MSEHAPEHEALIRAVVVGERPPDDPEVLRRRAECAACDAALARLMAAAARLDEEAREELAILALAEAVTDEPGIDRIEAFRRHPEFRRGALPRPLLLRALSWAAGVGIAAALLLFVLFRAGGDGDPDPGAGYGGGPEDMLGDDEVELFQFDGFDDGLELRFQAGAGIRGNVAKWQLVVDGIAEDGSEFHVVFPAMQSPWSDPTKVRAFPDEITVKVRALNASGDTIRTSEPVTGRRAR